MGDPPWILVFLWDGWFVYWVLSAQRGPSRQGGDSALALLPYRVPAILAAILLLAPYLTLGFGQRQLFEPSRPLILIGIAIVVAGLATTVWARVSLGRQWTGRAAVNENHKLIVTGPYRFVRHPIYSGIILAFIGSVLAMGMLGTVLALVLIVPALSYKYRREERFLAAMLPEYDAYRARVPALVPGLNLFSGKADTAKVGKASETAPPSANPTVHSEDR